MNILHSGSLAASSGGPAMSAYLTLKGLNEIGCSTALVQYPLAEGDVLRGDDVEVVFASKPTFRKLGFSPKLKDEILALGVYDIYHAQGVWQWPTYALVDVAKQLGKPYLITPRGMLYPQDIAKSSTLFKKLSLALRLKSDLNKAACVHVTCHEEMVHCRNLGVKSPIAVIPNPVDVRDYMCAKHDDVFRVGYLGRLSPRKNVEGLIYAFSDLASKMHDAELVIIGGGDDKYETFLHAEVERLGLKNVRFLGFLTGVEKDKALADCSILAMPSEFENLGNVILEGLVRKKPCIATKGSPWSELEEHKCGWWVEYNQDAITEAIYKAYQTSKEELLAMGERGFALMQSNYSVPSVAKRMKQLYDWILGNCEKPEFVYLS